MDQEQVKTAVIAFIRQLCERHTLETVNIDAETDLFATGILDSMRFVELMNYLEADLAIAVPDKMLITEHFRTPAIIARNFSVATG